MSISIYNRKASTTNTYSLDMAQISDTGIYKINYHKTLLNCNLKESDTCIIEIFLSGDKLAQYNYIEFIKHIRLQFDNSICINTTHFDRNGGQAEDLMCDSEPYLSEKEFRYLIDPGIVHIDNVDIENETLIKIRNLISPEKPSNLSRHDLSNRWGPYKMLKTLNSYDSNITYKNTEYILAEDLYFKKLIYNNNEENTFELDALDNKISDKLRYIQGLNGYKIALIDDESNKGWSEVYSGIFQNADFISLYDRYCDENSTTSSEEDFECIKSKLENNNEDYNLIILDLRLFERTNDNIIEYSELQNLSGIKILNLLKRKKPTIPIIICTASDKAHNHENIINCGANGFWTKESPENSYIESYSKNNLFALLKNIEKCLNWRKRIHPIYTSINFIYSKASDELVKSSIKNKQDLILSQMCLEYNEYLRTLTSRSGYDFSFILAYSLLINNIKQILTKESYEEENTYNIYNMNNKIVACKIDNQNNSYPSYFIIDNEGSKKEVNNYDTEIIIKLIEDSNIENALNLCGEFKKYRHIRNKLSFVHADNQDVPYSDLIGLINLSYKLVEHYT